jgi:hypothetical protein
MINRRTFILSSLVFALIATIIILGWGIIRKTQLDSSSQILALETIETLLKPGDRENMLMLMSDSNYEVGSKESFATRLFNLKRHVGALQTIDSFIGASDVPLLPFSRPPTAFYQFDLNMIAGPITMTIELIWANGSWQFSSINFAGDLLIN